jgi:uncharacterized protein YgiM (DUF1202 family)
MQIFCRFMFSLALSLGVWGCAAPEPARVAPPVETPVQFYLGALDLHLKSAPDPGSQDGARVSLNERVQSLERGAGGWFLVRAADGRQGWVSDKFLKVDPVTNLYVRRWGAKLQATPDDRGKTLQRLRANDEIQLLDPQPKDFARVTLGRTQDTGWVKVDDLSMARVVVKARKRRVAAPAGSSRAAEEAEESQAEEAADAPVAPAKPSVLGPPAAEAAPPPGDKQPARPKAKPGMFDPF